MLAAMPAGFRPIVVDNGSTDGSGAIAAEHGATVVAEPRRGFGAACAAGLTAATSGGRLLHGLRRLASTPAELPTGRRAGRRRRRRPGARRAPRRPGAWPLHARIANRRARARAAAPLRAAAAPTSARCAPPAARPCSGSRSATGASAGRWRWSCARPRRAGRSRRSRSATAPRVGRSKVTGTARGTARAVARHGQGAAMSALDPSEIC